MGDPKKARKKYVTPLHPWQKKRIEEEKELVREFGFKNKKEIWKLGSFLRKIKSQVKSNITNTSEQANTERQALVKKLQKLGLLGEKADIDEILGMPIRAIMNRRLQTIVFRKGLARSVSQARQYIVHQHIMVNGKKITSPNYLVTKSEEEMITFAPHSSLSDPMHPERDFEIKEEVPAEEVAEEKKGREPKKGAKREDRKKPAPKKKADKRENKK